MKKLIYGTLFLTIVGISISSCEKEKVSPINDTVQNTVTTKSNNTIPIIGDLDLMAQAANLTYIKKE